MNESPVDSLNLCLAVKPDQSELSPYWRLCSCGISADRKIHDVKVEQLQITQSLVQWMFHVELEDRSQKILAKRYPGDPLI